MDSQSLHGLKVAMYEVPDKPDTERARGVTEFSYIGRVTAMTVPSYMRCTDLIKLVNSEGEIMFGREKKDDDWFIIRKDPMNSERPLCKYGRSSFYEHDVVP